AGNLFHDAAGHQPAAAVGPQTHDGESLVMAGPSTHADIAAELATRPGHTNLRATLVRWLLITVSLTFLGALLAAPLAAVFSMALEQGWSAYFSSFSDEATRAST